MFTTRSDVENSSSVRGSIQAGLFSLTPRGEEIAAPGAFGMKKEAIVVSLYCRGLRIAWG